MVIRDCEVCPGRFTATGDEVLCPVCAAGRVRDRVASNLDLAVEALTTAETHLDRMVRFGGTSLADTKAALRLVRRAIGRGD